MSKYRLPLAIAVVLLGLGALIYVGTSATARAVVTVNELADESLERSAIRLAARVTDDPVDYQTVPSFKLTFHVHDIKAPESSIPVVYHGIMPDTLQQGRDVILEGDYVGEQFVAKNLLTQCPSKYEAGYPEE